MDQPKQEWSKKAARELAQNAGMIGDALGKTIESLEGVLPAAHPLRTQLAEMARDFGVHRLRAEDVASGAHAKRKEPLVAAIAKARAEGGIVNWIAAMECLAQAALDEQRPAWYAGAMLAKLEIDMVGHGVMVAKALACPIDAERSLGAAGYSWDWPEGTQQSRDAWSEAARTAGVEP